MHGARVVVLLGLFVLAAGMSILGCEGDRGPEGAVGPQGPQGEPGLTGLNVIATLEIFRDYEGEADLWGRFAANVYNAPSIPELTLNNLPVFLDPDLLFEGSDIFFYDLIEMEGVDSANIGISYTMLDGTSGSASSVISVPSEFSPVNNNINILVGDSVVAEWELSSGADAYWIYSTFHFDYFDTADIQQTIMVEFDTVLTADDTTLVVSGSDIFPDTSEINSIAGFDGFFLIRAVTGPWLPGQANNFIGDAFGVFIGTTDPIYIDVDLGPVAILEKTFFPQVSESRIGAEGLFQKRVLELSH